jgi:hypothetical protein
MKNLLNELRTVKNESTTKRADKKTKNTPTVEAISLKNEETNNKINIANVIVSPTSAEERDAARRASLKILSSRLSHRKSDISNDEIREESQGKLY